MTPSGKAGAQRRVDRIRAFREELAGLEADGVLQLTPEQRQRVEAHHDATVRALAERFDVDTTESAKRISWGMRIASTIAGLALCAAAVLFFYRFWGALGTPAQVAVLVAAPLALIGAMEFSARRERTYYYTALLGMLAFAAAVLNLNALGAMFNLAGSPNAFLVWAVFGLGLAYAYRLKLLLAAGLVCAILFVAATLASAAGLYWAAIELRMENVMAGGALVLAASAVIRHRKTEEFPGVYRLVGLAAIFIAILMVATGGQLSYLRLARHTVELIYQAAGLGLAAAAMWYGVARQMPGVVNLAAGAFAVYLYIRLYNWWWEWMPKYLFFFIIGLISLALLYVFQRLRRRTL